MPITTVLVAGWLGLCLTTVTRRKKRSLTLHLTLGAVCKRASWLPQGYQMSTSVMLNLPVN